MKLRNCELCGAAAAIYCPSDDAFLCRTCDAEVHDANFLVARHVRRSVCPICSNLAGNGFSGADCPPSLATCPSCAPASDDDGGVTSSGYSSDCISSTASPAKVRSECASGERRLGGESRRTDYAGADGVFAEWCRVIGVAGDGTAVRMACKGLRACSGSWAAVPYRVCLAASMWLGLRLAMNKEATWQVLKRLEAVSGVPAGVILAAELKLERGLKGARRRLQRRRVELEEGWAEC
ncbi:zinc finger family protein [Striga asiatica]|uniref:Zinc finger family protein n=1 Tax=Striga asiatica TaxID=4170 RepID=A0A5A7R7L0_STRAF|nr:zinc finger family protein [Striga asiatica]